MFAALDVATGTVLARRLPKHRHQEFLVFLRTSDRNVPKALQVHLSLDNYHTHRHPETKAWLDQHLRFHPQLTPISSSWLNLVERWIRELAEKNIRGGSLLSVPDQIASIGNYLRVTDAIPKPLIWTASAESILETVRRGRFALNQSTKTETPDEPQSGDEGSDLARRSLLASRASLIRISRHWT
jgi:hypothetical protein